MAMSQAKALMSRGKCSVAVGGDMNSLDENVRGPDVGFGGGFVLYIAEFSL